MKLLTFHETPLLLQIFKKLYIACLRYEDWKTAHSPGLKPWRNPEQNQLPLVGIAHSHALWRELWQFVGLSSNFWGISTLSVIHFSILKFNSNMPFCNNFVLAVGGPKTAFWGIPSIHILVTSPLRQGTNSFCGGGTSSFRWAALT